MKLRSLLAVAILAVALAGPTVELFDHWDHTLQDGNDIEGSTVVVALCIGLAVTVAAARTRAKTSLSPRADVVPEAARSTNDQCRVFPVLLFGASPPVPLRL